MKVFMRGLMQDLVGNSYLINAREQAVASIEEKIILSGLTKPLLVTMILFGARMILLTSLLNLPGQVKYS